MSRPSRPEVQEIPDRPLEPAGALEPAAAAWAPDRRFSYLGMGRRRQPAHPETGFAPALHQLKR